MTDANMELMHGLLKQMNGFLGKLAEGQRLTNERLAASGAGDVNTDVVA